MARRKPPRSLTISEVIPDWKTSLRAADKSPKTIYSYALSAQMLSRFLAEHDMPQEVDKITWEHINEFQADQLAHGKPTTAMVRYKSLQQFFGWLLKVDLIAENPMTKVEAPTLHDEPVPVIDDDTLSTLLKATAGTRLTDRRDYAIFRVAIDTGCRLAELTGLEVKDYDKETQTLTFLGKGRRVRTVRIANKAAEAVNAYLRERKQREDDNSAMWMGRAGAPLTTSGMRVILGRRCDEAGIERLNFHRFRHTAAHVWMADEHASEGDLMVNLGWSSRQMLDRYGKSAAAERAREASKRLPLGDRV
jgi:site-specific recombinase XerD